MLAVCLPTTPSPWKLPWHEGRRDPSPWGTAGSPLLSKVEERRKRRRKRGERRKKKKTEKEFTTTKTGYFSPSDL